MKIKIEKKLEFKESEKRNKYVHFVVCFDGRENIPKCRNISVGETVLDMPIIDQLGEVYKVAKEELQDNLLWVEMKEGYFTYREDGE